MDDCRIRTVFGSHPIETWQCKFEPAVHSASGMQVTASWGAGTVWPVYQTLSAATSWTSGPLIFVCFWSYPSATTSVFRNNLKIMWAFAWSLSWVGTFFGGWTVWLIAIGRTRHMSTNGTVRRVLPSSMDRTIHGPTLIFRLVLCTTSSISLIRRKQGSMRSSKPSIYVAFFPLFLFAWTSTHTSGISHASLLMQQLSHRHTSMSMSTWIESIESTVLQSPKQSSMWNGSNCPNDCCYQELELVAMRRLR